MPLLNFQPRFVEPIRLSVKAHTIRAERKIPIKVGDKLYLYCGLRHPGAFRILPEPQACTKVRGIWIEQDEGPRVRLFVDGEFLYPDECEQLAVADGFSDFAEMMSFWDGRLPFNGNIVHWR